MSILTQKDYTLRTDIKSMIEFVMSPHEELGAHGYVEGKQITERLAALFQSHQFFSEFGHIEPVGNRFYLWRKKEWDTLYRNRQLRAKEDELNRVRIIQNESRFTRAFEKLRKKYIKIQDDKIAMLELLKMWIEDVAEGSDIYKHELEKLGFFDGIEEDAQKLEELKIDLEAYRARMSESQFNH